MTLDEAIEYYINVATQRAVADEGMGVNDKWNETKFMTKKESEQIIADNRQLAEWLTELKELRSLKTDYVFFKAEARKLLETAVEDIARTESCFLCKYYDRPDWNCQTTDDCFVWRYTDEVKKLINDEK